MNYQLGLGLIPDHFQFMAGYRILKLSSRISDNLIFTFNNKKSTDGHTDIQTDLNCIVIKNFVTQFLFSTKLSENLTEYLVNSGYPAQSYYQRKNIRKYKGKSFQYFFYKLKEMIYYYTARFY